MHEQMRKTDALNVPAEGQSLKSYKRLILAQSFQTPKQKQSRVSNCPFKKQKHSPKFDNVLWSKETVLADLRPWPIGNITGLSLHESMIFQRKMGGRWPRNLQRKMELMFLLLINDLPKIE